MWGFDEFIAKAKLYFSRSEGEWRSSGPVDSAASLWLLLGFEFLLRAPLAKVNPTLLAAPEGRSILHAAGLVRPGMDPRSVPTKTVIERLLYIEPEFSEDRKSDALFLMNLRNGELHNSDAVLENLAIEVWLPRLLDVIESICNHLSMAVEDFLPAEVVGHAEAARLKNDRALANAIHKKVAEAKRFYGLLKPEEVAARLAERLALVPGQRTREITCPSCDNTAARLVLTAGKAGRGTYDDNSGQISYSVTFLAESLFCHVCNLSLENTSEVVAAGLDRLYVDEYEEDRYEGWEDVISHSDIARLGIGEPDYEYDNE